MSAEQTQPPLARASPPWSEDRVLATLTAALGLFSLLLLLATEAGAEDWLSPLAGLTAFAILAGSLVTAATLARKARRYLFLPVTSFLAACGLYFGAGSLLHFFGSETELVELNAIVKITPTGYARVMLLNAGTMSLVLGCYLLWRIALRPLLAQTGDDSEQPHSRRLDLVVLALAMVGLFVRFRFALAYELKLAETPPTGLVIALTHFTYGAHYYFWEQVGRRERSRWPIIALLALDASYGAISLSKTAIFLPVLSAFLGYAAGRNLPLRKWLLALAAAVLIAIVLQPVNTYLRLGRALAPTLSVGDAVRGLQDGSLEDVVSLNNEGQLGTLWSRLAYAGDQLYCIEAYSRGERGTSYRYLVDMWIPRFLWRAKPLAVPGLEHARLTRGLDETYTSATLFGEAYFNAGFLGIAFFSLLLSAVLCLYEFPARWVLQQRRTEYSVVLFSGIFVGLRVDDWAVMVAGAVVSSLGILVVMAIAARWARTADLRTAYNSVGSGS